MILNEKSFQSILKSSFNISQLKNKKVLITGATGMIGKALIDFIIFENHKVDLRCEVIALGRNTEKAKNRFEDYWDDSFFNFLEKDISIDVLSDVGAVDYVIHAASTTHPLQYSTNPVGTLESNVLGTKNLLDFLKEKNRNGIFLLLSSVEVYGDSRGDVDSFTEDYEGKLNWNSLRACYSESKRLCETMCQAYIQQYGISSKIVRLSRVYGPTMLMSDSKVMSQFIKNALNRENIVLKSSGNQYFSYTYVTDAVAGILTVMLNGDTGEAYNIVSKNSNVHLRELAKQISNFVGVKVIFDLPNETEKRGYSKSSVAILDDTKVQKIGYKSQVSLKQGVRDTLDFLKKVKNTNRVI